jgi:hypothetical protein
MDSSGRRHVNSRSRSRQRHEEPPRRQLRSHTRAATAIQVAHANNPQSISRLHDDELSCILPFLELADLAQFVRCNRRFNAVARKERSRGLHLESDANPAPLLLSSLGHHVSSLHLERLSPSDAPLTRDILHQLRDLPRLTSLEIVLPRDDDVDHLMQGLSLDSVAAELRAVLPTQLRSFTVVVGQKFGWLDEKTAALASSFWAALGDMTQLTELTVKQQSLYMHIRPELAQLVHLRKLTLGPAGEVGEHVGELKQLSQLRELTLLDRNPERIRLLCQPPHALQLDCLSLPSTGLDAETMRALLHLPMLTTLDSCGMSSDPWPLLPQLPCLRCFSFHSYSSLTPEHLSSLCAAFSHCSALEELTLKYVRFSPLSAEQKRAAWAALLSSVPSLRRLGVYVDVTHLIPVLPLHLPVLEHLSLSGWGDGGVDHLASVAHPNVRVLEFGLMIWRQPSDEQLRACMHSERLPKLERCVFRADCVVV